jgi:hypothetical protein
MQGPAADMRSLTGWAILPSGVCFFRWEAVRLQQHAAVG